MLGKCTLTCLFMPCEKSLFKKMFFVICNHLNIFKFKSFGTVDWGIQISINLHMALLRSTPVVSQSNAASVH